MALVAVNVLMFGLELAWGGFDSPPTLLRMGAGLGRAGLVREPWRMVSAAFLHFSVAHLLFNMWALFAFGRMLEAILGARRFLILYALSAAAGGLASSLFHAQVVSAGASGAVWGLMTGQIASVVRLRRQQGPDRVPVRMSSLLQPLVVNLLYSLTPGIDIAAHLGGGVAGAGLILSGLVGWSRPEPPAWRRAAWVASIGMATCIALALGHGRPWELLWPPSLVPRTIPGTPVVVPVPRGLQPALKAEGGFWVFGDLSADPLAVYCATGRLEAHPQAHPQAQDEDALEQMAREETARTLQKNESWDQKPRVVQIGQRRAVFFATRVRDWVRIETWLMAEGSWWLRLDVMRRPDAPESWGKLPATIAEGVRIVPQPTSR